MLGNQSGQIDIFNNMIYEKLIPKDHLLLKINNIIDFSFVIVEKCIESDLIKAKRYIIDSTDVSANANYPSEKNYYAMHIEE